MCFDLSSIVLAVTMTGHLLSGRHFGEQVLEQAAGEELSGDLKQLLFRKIYDVWGGGFPASLFMCFLRLFSMGVPSQTFRNCVQRFVEHIDGQDNGVEVADGPLNYKISTDLSSRVDRLNIKWNEEHSVDLENVRQYLLTFFPFSFCLMAGRMSSLVS